MRDGFIPINQPLLDDAEVDAAVSVIRSGALTSPAYEGGEHVRRLERAVRDFTGARHAVAVNSGTAALQAALLALDVGAGDEVIVPSFTYVATANAVKSVGATPVFADISQNSYQINPGSVRYLITDRTAAVIPVHLYGLASDMDGILEAAGDIPVIEDAAQSLGSTLRGKHTGTLADLGCYSLYPGKVATAGEGGIVVTGDDKTHERLLALRNHGNTGDSFGTFGINLRMPEISAAIATVQMNKLPSFIGARRRNAAALTTLLREDNSGPSRIRLPPVTSEENPNWSLYTISVPDRDKLLRLLNQNGVGAAVYYKMPVHTTPSYSSGQRALPRTEEAAGTVLSIPVHPAVTAEDTERMASIIRAAQ